MNTYTRNTPLIDFTAPEIKDYSFCRAIMAACTGEKCVERDFSDEFSRKSKRFTGGLFIPTTIPMANDAMRAAYAATGTGSGLVANTTLDGQFIDALRNKARIIGLGAQMLSGLRGNVAIPRQKSASISFWITPEGSDVTESEGIYEQINMSPKTLGARSQYTRQLLLQGTADVEKFVRFDLSRTMATAIDLACISGTGAAGGTGEPLGILSAGVSTVPLGTNGGALTIDALIELEDLLTEANVDDAQMAYLTNAKQIKSLKALKDSSGRYLWNQYPGAATQRSGVLGEINGYSVARSNQVPSNLTKGIGTNLSSVVMGDWSELIIGEWGVLEILPNPYGAGFASGTIDIRVMQSIDIQLRHQASFAAIVDAT